MKRLFPILVLVLIGLTSMNNDTMSEQQDHRLIRGIHQALREDVGTLITYRAMPTQQLSIKALDPFLMLNHHGPQDFEPNNTGLPFGPHPHRGFETITFILEGDIAHRDNSGHESVIETGGVQWMTAGSGIIHSELASEKFEKEGGRSEVLQLWLNLPSKLKGAKPSYNGLQKEDLVSIKEDGYTVNLIAGEWKGQKAPIQSLTNAFMSYLEMDKGSDLQATVAENRQPFLYVARGAITINGELAPRYHVVEFAPKGELLDIKATEESVILFGHAEPTRDPIAARGPFVMNTEAEIQQAIIDYQMGRFGDTLY